MCLLLLAGLCTGAAVGPVHLAWPGRGDGHGGAEEGEGEGDGWHLGAGLGVAGRRAGRRAGWSAPRDAVTVQVDPTSWRAMANSTRPLPAGAMSGDGDGGEAPGCTRCCRLRRVGQRRHSSARR